MTVHMPPFLSPLTFLTCSATRAASVKASLTPRFFIAEHSVHRQQSFSPPDTVSNVDGRRTEISKRPDLLRNSETLLVIDHWFLRFRPRRILLFGRGFAQVALQGHEHETHAWAVLGDFGDPF